MGLNWVRLDVTMPRNHKVTELLSMRDGHRSAFVYTCLLAYCGDQETDGFIPRFALPDCRARPVDMERLVQVRLIQVDEGGGGWNIPDWAEYQPTTETSRRRSRSARDAANVRWAAERAKKEREKKRKPPEPGDSS